MTYDSAVQAACERIKSFTHLAEGWDSYGAKPITSAAIAKALRLAGELPHIDRAGIHPTHQRGIEIDWDSGGLLNSNYKFPSVSLDIEADGRITWAHLSSECEVISGSEEPVDELPYEVIRAIRKVVEEE